MHLDHRVAVIVPALDEAASLPGVLDSIPDFVDRIVVVDNDSTDDTAAVARAWGAEVVVARPRGYGTAVQRGRDLLASR